MKLEQIIKLKLNNFKIEVPNKLEIEPNPCWEGYETIGLKEDGSPNCVPIKEEQSKQDFVIPSPENNESKDVYIARCNAAISDEYGYEQANGICYSQWEKKGA